MKRPDPNRDPNTDPHEPLTTRARGLFDRASARLDIATANRLRLMRRDAQSQRPRHSLQALLPVGASAAAVLALGLAWWLPRNDAVPATQAAPAVAIEAAQEAYLDEEDAELYAWLGEAPVATGKTSGKTL